MDDDTKGIEPKEPIIGEIVIAFGPPHEQLVVTKPQVIVFVGPNSSGKSMVLSELSSKLNLHGTETNILKSIRLNPAPDFLDIGFLELDDDKVHFSYKPSRGSGSRKANITTMAETFARPSKLSDFTKSVLLPSSTIYHATGSQRLNLPKIEQSPNLLSPSTPLAKLFTNADVRQRIQCELHDAFNTYLVLDHLSRFGHLALGFIKTKPNPNFERSLCASAIKQLKEFLPIDSMSDGVKAYTGLLLKLFTATPRVLLLDEPEAFLHPPLARRLGQLISKTPATTSERPSNVFVSTHSAHFVMGCVESKSRVDIVRLTHDASTGKSTARLLEHNTLKELMHQPLLRSNNVLDALFHKCVVVVEGDSDRTFLQEINFRLIQANDARGIRDCLFIQAQNKQTVATIMAPLRKLGIPAAGVVDIDIYKDDRKPWAKLLNSLGIPKLSHDSIKARRSALKAAFDKCDCNPKRDGGITCLSPSDQRSANDFFDELAKYGLFVIRSGEIESFLKPLNVTGEKTGWLVSMFKRLGSDPSDPNYISPGDGDVWDFIQLINAWCTNPNKFGCPIDDETT